MLFDAGTAPRNTLAMGCSASSGVGLTRTAMAAAAPRIFALAGCPEECLLTSVNKRSSNLDILHGVIRDQKYFKASCLARRGDIFS
jgi:uncharacterized metal-binding protein